MTKRIHHYLPDGLQIGEVLEWCRANDIPALHTMKIALEPKMTHGVKRFRSYDYDMVTQGMDKDTLIVREQDYALVRLRF